MSSSQRSGDQFVICRGMGPMLCLSRWWLRLLVDALRHSDRAIKLIAEPAGVGSTAALTRALKWEFAGSPSFWRRRANVGGKRCAATSLSPAAVTGQMSGFRRHLFSALGLVQRESPATGQRVGIALLQNKRSVVRQRWILVIDESLSEEKKRLLEERSQTDTWRKRQRHAPLWPNEGRCS